MTDEEIRNKAFLIWEADKRKDPLKCWFEAEEELKAIENLSFKALRRAWGQEDI